MERKRKLLIYLMDIGNEVFWEFLGGPVAKNSMRPVQGAWVWFLVKELDPTWCNQDSVQPKK